MQLNHLLCESKEPVGVWELMTATVRKSIVAAESKGGTVDSNGYYEAKLFQCDVANGNGRIYTRDCMQANLDRLRPQLKDGMLCGSVDHGTGLKNQAVIYRDIQILDDGSAWGKFEIVPTSVGKDLQIQCDSGMAVGFSTYGYGTAHKPSDEERAKYKLPAESDDDYTADGEYCGPVVMNGDYEMVKIDPVDDPAVHDARIVQKQSKGGVPVSDADVVGGAIADARMVGGKPISEACESGLHWIELGVCGHVVGQCRCEAEKKHYVYSDSKKCEKCSAKSPVEGLTATELKKLFADTKVQRKAVQEGKQEPLAKTYTQYIAGRDTFEPARAIKLAPELTANAYSIVPTWDGVRFVRKPVQTDELYHFEGSVMESVLQEIDNFWGLKEEYAKYGVMFHRGILMHGSPGTGKTSAVNQAVEMVTGRGDVVFYGRDISTLKEGLTAFREVEPDRKVVVILEDADEYVGYQERDMLNLLDGAETIEGILYLATTNYLDRFPPRLLRPGRFDKKVHVGPPPEAGRKAYLQKKLGQVESPEEIDRLTAETEGLSFGHLRELITAVYALKEPKSSVLARLKGVKKSPSDASSRLRVQTEQSEKKISETKIMPDTKVNEALNTFLGALKESDLELPTREVLPAEFAAQLESANKTIKALQDEIETIKSAKATVDAKLAEIEAAKAEEARLASVMTKAAELLKDSAFADAIAEDVKDQASADGSFDATKVEALVKLRTARYEKAAGPALKLPIGTQGRSVSEENLNEIDEELENIESEEVEESVEVEPAEELNFGRKAKK